MVKTIKSGDYLVYTNKEPLILFDNVAEFYLGDVIKITSSSPFNIFIFVSKKMRDSSLFIHELKYFKKLSKSEARLYEL